MGASLIGGLIDSGYPASAIRGAEPDAEQRKKVTDQIDIEIFKDNSIACHEANVIVLAVKPQTLLTTLQALKEKLVNHNCLIVSIAAGITCASITSCLAKETAIVRVMPNTPALIGMGASGLFANPFVSDDQKQQAETIVNSVGLSTWVTDEELIDTVTAVSGSGPAYYFLFMEIMEQAAIEMGLTVEQAQMLVNQTALGAAHMAKQSDDTVASLRQKITSPSGTTEAAIKTMSEGDIEKVIKKALISAKERAIEMAKEFGEEQGK